MTNRDERSSVAPDDLPDRNAFRTFFARNRTLDLTYRIVIGLVGAVVVVGGLVLIPLPGPGWLIVFAGLALLATEFSWAGRLLDLARARVSAYTDWVTRQSLLVRAVIALGSLLAVVTAVWLYVRLAGVPGWLPEWVPFA